MNKMPTKSGIKCTVPNCPEAEPQTKKCCTHRTRYQTCKCKCHQPKEHNHSNQGNHPDCPRCRELDKTEKDVVAMTTNNERVLGFKDDKLIKENPLNRVKEQEKCTHKWVNFTDEKRLCVNCDKIELKLSPKLAKETEKDMGNCGICGKYYNKRSGAYDGKKGMICIECYNESNNKCKYGAKNCNCDNDFNLNTQTEKVECKEYCPCKYVSKEELYCRGDKPEGVGEWVEEFDERFKWFFDNQTNESLKGTTTPTDIKSFISNLLLQEKAKWKDAGYKEGFEDGLEEGYDDN